MSNAFLKDKEFIEFFTYIYPVFESIQIEPDIGSTIRDSDKPIYSFNETKNWFNKILRNLEGYGVSPLIQSNKHKKNRISKTILSTRVMKQMDQVSLSKYVILEFNNLYTNQFLIQYPIKEYWSHHAVLALLKNIENRKINMMFRYDVTLKKDVRIAIKRFVNMVYGMVNAEGSDLSVIDDEFCANTFKTNALHYVTSFLPKDKIIIVASDEVVLNCTYEEFSNFSSVESVSKYSVTGRSDTKEGLKELNELCRKHTIDIVH